MIDIKRLADETDFFKQNLQKRGQKTDQIDSLLNLNNKRKELIVKTENFRNERNSLSKVIGDMKLKGEDSSSIEAKVKDIGLLLKETETALETLELEVTAIALTIPNILQDDVPIGKDEKDNKVIRTWGEKPTLNFTPKDHVDVGVNLGILDLDRAAKVTGARFTFVKGLGAKLERSLINFMLDTHTNEHGYTELLSPFMVNENPLIGTGQLPKFKEDLFKLEKYPYYLIPTAEVPVTNYYNDEILELKNLPVKFCAYTPCFRSEAGSYGKDTRGIIRQHQFNKVELVKITTPETSCEEHEKLTADAERILQKLGLHYRVISLCSGDIGFGASKCYDLEVWLPSMNTYKEISSCSNFIDFQARRAKIRYRDAKTGKPVFGHTINGSGLAVGRTLVAILEQYQQADGSVLIPNVLKPYMGVDKIS